MAEFIAVSQMGDAAVPRVGRLISVIVPTVDGRENYLAECKASYAAHTEDYELLVVENEPCCGSAWIKGSDDAAGDYIHFSADDLQPHAGWADAGMEVVGRGFLPAPRILNTDGSLQSCGDWEREAPTGERTEFTRIPFMSRDQWERIRPLVGSFLADAHYYTDNAISWAARTLGIETGVHRDYLFTHHLAEAKRGAGTTWEDRMQRDYEMWMRHVAAVTR